MQGTQPAPDLEGLTLVARIEARFIRFLSEPGLVREGQRGNGPGLEMASDLPGSDPPNGTSELHWEVMGARGWEGWCLKGHTLQAGLPRALVPRALLEMGSQASPCQTRCTVSLKPSLPHALTQGSSAQGNLHTWAARDVQTGSRRRSRQPETRRPTVPPQEMK